MYVGKLKPLNIEITESYLVNAVIGCIPDEEVAMSARSSRFAFKEQIRNKFGRWSPAW